MVWILSKKQATNFEDRNHLNWQIANNVWSSTGQHICSNILSTLYKWYKKLLKKLNFSLFANDRSTFLINKNIRDIENVYNQEFIQIIKWLNSNKLSLNVGNSNLVIFSKNRENTLHSLNIKIKRGEVKQKQFTKSLDILIDNSCPVTTILNM